MRVLVVTYHYPPDPAVGGIRAANVVKTLRERGHEATVLAAFDEYPAGPGVHRFQPLPNATEWYRRLSRKSSGNSAKAGAAPGRETAQPLPRWKRIALSAVLLPDEQQGFIWPAYALGRRISQEGVDLLVTTAPPHSVTVTGLLLKKKTKLPWIAEFRDPWIDNAIKPPYHTRFRARAERLMERVAMGNADAVIPVTEAAADLLRERTADPTKVKVIRNGIPSLARPTHRDGSGTFRIVHTGTLYGRRDPRPLITAVGELRRTQPTALPDSISIEFVGDCAWYRPLIEEAARHLAPCDRVTFHGVVDQERAGRLMSEADLLILLAQDQPLQVPQKLYDYLSAHRPILGFVDQCGESAAMLERAGNHLLVYGDSTGEIVQRLEEAIRTRDHPFKVNESLISQWSVGQQMNRLVDIMEEVVDSRTSSVTPEPERY